MRVPTTFVGLHAGRNLRSMRGGSRPALWVAFAALVLPVGSGQVSAQVPVNGGPAAVAIPSAPVATIPPRPTRWFNDYAKVAGPSFALDLDRRLERFEQETTDQLLVVLFPKLPPGMAVDDYCKGVFNAWGIGQKGINNGVVLFVFMDDHKLRIEVGRGLEATLTNPICQEIVHTIAARFRTGDYEGGLAVGVDAITKVLQGQSPPPPTAH